MKKREMHGNLKVTGALAALLVSVFWLGIAEAVGPVASDGSGRRQHPGQGERATRAGETEKSAFELFSRKAIERTMNYKEIDTGGSWSALPFTREEVDQAMLPGSFDWRELGGVSAIDFQPDYGCGGCWVYSATAVFESLIKIRTGLEVDLSEEQISSCLRNGNHTGIAWQAFNFMQANGVTTEEHIPCDYSSPVCDYEMNSDAYYLNDNWILGMYELPLDERVKIIKYIIQTYGPVASGFIVYEDWANYRSGIYLYDHQSALLGHHSIALVGWADDASVPEGGYWIVKNDFGASWGESGYFRIGYGECEIDLVVMFAAWDPDTPYPVFATKVGTRYYYTGESIELDVSARVPPGHSPSYMAVGLPAGAFYDQMNGLFTWTPSESQVGTHEIDFIAFYDNYSTTQTGVIVIVKR